MYSILIFISFTCVTLGAHLPSNIITCKLSDPNFEECLKSAVEDTLHNHINGIEELDFPSLEPFSANPIVMEKVPGPISLKQQYTNITFYGFSKAKVLKFKVHLKSKCLLDADILLPDFAVTAHYVINGEMLIFPIDAEGDFRIDYTTARVRNRMSCEKLIKDGKEYINITSSRVNFTFDNLKFNLGTIIQGNEQLDRDIHQIIDEDPKAFFEVIRPGAMAMVQKLYVQLSNEIFTKVPVKEIFNE